MKVEIWSDVVCPWCYIGKRRFEAALQQFPHEVELTWRSFELDPTAPTEAVGTYGERLATKYGRTLEQAQEMLDHMTEVAAQEGLAFDFAIARGGNTFDAHRLLHLARRHGLQDALKERLDKATFGEGLAVADHAALTALAVEVGLDEAEVSEVLASGAHAGDVLADQAQARAYGITAVPFFVLDGRIGVSGAQPAEELRRALEQAWAGHQPLTVVSAASAGESCEGDACVV